MFDYLYDIAETAYHCAEIRNPHSRSVRKIAVPRCRCQARGAGRNLSQSGTGITHEIVEPVFAGDDGQELGGLFCARESAINSA